MLDIKNLHASIDGRSILEGIDLQVNSGEVHAIMGPNGSGKSTLAHILTGREGYDITRGGVQYAGRDLFEMTAEERAREGLFLAFQYPVEIPGVNNGYFLRTALNSIRKQRGEKEIDAFDFINLVRDKMTLVGVDEALLNRPVNAGFSGGEKKRNEILQMLVLQPALAILDETDSGLDIDALKIVAHGINTLRDEGRAIILITHYQRLLEYVQPDFVHVLASGRIARSGDSSLALTLEEQGYGWLEPKAAALQEASPS